MLTFDLICSFLLNNQTYIKQKRRTKSVLCSNDPFLTKIYIEMINKINDEDRIESFCV